MDETKKGTSVLSKYQSCFTKELHVVDSGKKKNPIKLDINENAFKKLFATHTGWFGWVDMLPFLSVEDITTCPPS